MAIADQSQHVYEADLGEDSTPQEQRLRAELIEMVETLYGDRLYSARDYLRFLMEIEDKMELQAMENNPRLQAELDQAVKEHREGKSVPWQQSEHDV